MRELTVVRVFEGNFQGHVAATGGRSISRQVRRPGVYELGNGNVRLVFSQFILDLSLVLAGVARDHWSRLRRDGREEA